MTMKQNRISDYNISIGKLPRGALNKITDVEGVRVGHSTIRSQEHNTGVTVILPSPCNIFANKLISAVYVHNGFGKSMGTVQLEELGTLETPIALTNTLNVGLVADALVQYTIEQCQKENFPVYSVNPIVGECNDCRLNLITERAVSEKHVFEAIQSAEKDFEEGNVGAGTGTICYGLKGGIGSASRIIELDGKAYTLGILVQSNYGATADLTISGRPVGREISCSLSDPGCDKGSIMVILATDVPLTHRQLKRVLKRCSVGIARLGSYIGHGSGEVFIGFSTANVIPADSGDILPLHCIREDKTELLFRAAGEATEEAILNSMICSDPVTSPSGRITHSLREFISLPE